MSSDTPPPEAPASPLAVGDVLAGKYRVDRILGAGGMGVVIAATHLTLHQKVAIKFLLPSGAQLPETAERFLREARAAVRLKSEHVAKVIDVGTLEDGAPYMVMEYLEGATLGQVVRQHGALPIADAVAFVMQACEAVAEAHAAGIVHRDLKPDNLFLTRRVDGQPLVKVLDFGIAKLTGIDAKLALTRSASVVGSPLYMPPEQLRSAKHVDARADIWALGTVLFELLTGRLPFVAQTFPELCMKVAQDPAPAPSEHRAEIPPELDAAVLRCLQKDVALRFQNVGDMAHALQPFAPEEARDFAKRITSVLAAGTWPPREALSGPVITAATKVATGNAWGNTRGAGASRRRLTWIGAGAAACAVVAIAVVVLRHGPATPPAASAVDPGVASAAPLPSAQAPALAISLAPVDPAPSSTATPTPSAPAVVAAVTAPGAPPRPRPGTPAAPAHSVAAPSPAPAPPPAPSPPGATTGGDIVFQRK
jgi:serine/threonine protein kinase